MPPELTKLTDLSQGTLACHRRQPMLMPDPLGVLKLTHHPCLREKCTLWDPVTDQCRDVTNALTLCAILGCLRKLIDHLPPELP